MKSKLKIFIILTLFFSNILTCSASTKTFDRNELENYGINKDWIVVEDSKDIISDTPAVDAKEKIYDYADILTDEEEQQLKSEIDEFSKSINMDMVVVTVNQYFTEKENEDYAANFYDYNDFGLDYPNNSGLIFLRNANEIDPYYAIYTFGDAQLYFSDSRIDRVLDSIYSDIHGRNYLSGFRTTFDILSAQYSSGIPKELETYKVDEKGKLYEPYSVPWGQAIIFATVVTAVTLIIMVKKNMMVMKAYNAAEYLDKRSLAITEKKDRYVTSHTSSYTISSDSGGGGGFSSSIGSSGGGHGGGGRHG